MRGRLRYRYIYYHVARGLRGQGDDVIVYAACFGHFRPRPAFGQDDAGNVVVAHSHNDIGDGQGVIAVIGRGDRVDGVCDRGNMVAFQRGEMTRVPLGDAIAELKYASPQLRAAARSFFA